MSTTRTPIIYSIKKHKIERTSTAPISRRYFQDAHSLLLPQSRPKILSVNFHDIDKAHTSSQNPLFTRLSDLDAVDPLPRRTPPIKYCECSLPSRRPPIRPILFLVCLHVAVTPSFPACTGNKIGRPGVEFFVQQYLGNVRPLGRPNRVTRGLPYTHYEFCIVWMDGCSTSITHSDTI